MLKTLDVDQTLARAADGVCLMDGEGKIRFWNRAAERLLGFSGRDVVGRTCCDVLGGRDDSGNRLCYPGCQVRTLVGLNEGVEHFDMRTRTKTGQPVWLDISVLPLTNGGNGAPSIVYLFRDVTATRELLRLVHERLAPPPNGEDGGAPLTRRELEIVRLLADGATTRRMAEQLHVSRATIRNHVQNILGKLGVHSRLEAVAYANRHRLL
jgi:PAS domain S-box-containing protein